MMVLTLNAVAAFCLAAALSLTITAFIDGDDRDK